MTRRRKSNGANNINGLQQQHQQSKSNGSGQKSGQSTRVVKFVGGGEQLENHDDKTVAIEGLSASSTPKSVKMNGFSGAGGMHRSPSENTLNQLERQKIVLWRKPFHTIFYFLLEILFIIKDCALSSLSYWRRIGLVIIPCIPAFFYLTMLPEEHRLLAESFQKQIIWCLYWIGLGVLSSIGLGTGLHTFLIYLGPHIARVTLAAFECNSLDFPEPPYPDDVICPNGNGNNATVLAATAISLWNIVSKVRVESLMWGAGTALGELPPYFMARAARLSGEEPEDEDLKEFLEWQQMTAGDVAKELGVLDKIKLWMEQMVSRVGFFGILLFASIPNPFFDLAGITCGHFLIPFWTFFGATLIGKAIVKMHIQMLFVVLAFSEHHMEKLLDLLNQLPYVGSVIQAPVKEFLSAQKTRLHRKPGAPVPEQAAGLLQVALSLIVTAMIIWFVISLINSLAQRYHKRCWQSSKKKRSSKLAVFTNKKPHHH